MYLNLFFLLLMCWPQGGSQTNCRREVGGVQWAGMYRNRLCTRWRQVQVYSGNNDNMYLLIFYFHYVEFYCFLIAFWYICFFVFQIEILQKYIKKFYGENPRKSGSISRIINKNHFERLQNLLKDPFVADSIVHGGSLDEEAL